MPETTTLRTVECPAMWGGLLDGGYDEYNRRVGSNPLACGICGRTVLRGFMVHAINGGPTLLHPDDEGRYDGDGDMGCWSIGRTCAQHVPEEFRSPLPVRQPPLPAARVIAEGRAETDPCEASTVGCSIDHTAERTASPSTEQGCETW